MKSIFFLGALTLGVVGMANAQVQVEPSTSGLHPGGQLQARSINGKAVPNKVTGTTLLFDSFTGATTLTSTTTTPHTYMGVPLDLANASGTVQINQIVVYMVSTAAVNYTDVTVNLALWDVWSGAANPVFSSPSGGVVIADFGALSAAASNFYTLTIPLATPITLNGLTNHGIAVNYKGDTGTGLADTNSLTSLLRYGNAFAVGDNPLTGYGYRNASGHTDLNFANTDSRSFGQTLEGMALQLTGSSSTPVSLQSFSVD
ncbi:hypothetical protein ELE36_09720 [Pseudolysobacter antarcticus]|uniref:Uncharacterized protein n=1 Tax=Pseudolysobacter antarcticus TaxID=2511995 RepID=A0A411HJG0_9GAMM|nr:hypothetical protein [Pseudolysobacter antarcticus]QBB70621.1 hypothetical protein ELE36_09720 [Pseudolysobacter antarcticus]